MKKLLCLCLFAGLFIFTSCGNLFENSVSEESSSKSKSSKKQTELEGASVKYVTLSGTFNTEELKGALPSKLLSAIYGTDTPARSAKPGLPTTSDYEYYVKAVSENNETIECDPIDSATGIVQYSLRLPIDVKWTFEAGLRIKANKKQLLLLDSETLAGKAFSKTFSDTKLNESHSFILQPLTDEKYGKGSIKLMMKKVPADVKELKILDSSGKNWLNGAVTIGLSTSDDNENYIKASDVKPGIYDVTFIFYREYSGLGNIKLPAYISYQTISVFANMETDTWVSGKASSTDQPITADGKFALTDALISSFMETTLYVGEPSQLVSGAQVANPDDNNAGTPYAPLRSFDGALKHIAASCKGTAYQIFISSQQKKAGGFKIPDSITTSVASSITICGLGSNRAVLDADNNGSVLTVDSPVPITLKNIQLTGGNAEDGGGIYMESGTSVTLETGALVGKDVEIIAESNNCGNKATQKGGGIYNHNGTLVLKNGSKVCNNFVESSNINNSGHGGGGISLYGGSLTIEDGAVISWNKCEAARGGGILVPDGDENNPSTLTMTGGEISHNEAKQYGGGVMIGHTGTVSLLAGTDFPAKTFNFSGGKISENTISTKSSNAPMAGGAGIFLDGGAFTMSGNAVIEENTAELSGEVGCGGGISISASAEETGTFSMQGGTIRNNSANQGGAVYFDDGSYQSGNYSHHSCSYSISGTAAIPYGVNGTQGAGKNDVYVGKTGSINISATLDNSFPETGISTAQANWTRGKIILNIADGVSVTQTLIDKFKCLFPTEDWEKIPSATQVTVNCPFYVGSYNGTAGVDDDDHGTRVSPFSTIAYACQQMDDATTEYIIKIIGTTAAVAQEIPSTLSTTKAKSVSIIGVSDATYPPVINRGLCNVATSGESDGSALKINSTVPVTITNVKITGGWTTGSGGGIDLETSGTLSLGDGVVVTGNRADNSGGGLFTRNGTIFIYGTAQIGHRPSDKVTTAPIANSLAGNCANWTDMNGGGIYVSEEGAAVGHIYLGYTKNSAGNPEKDEHFTGGIYYNYARYGGGAIFASGSEEKKPVVWISGGTVAYNYANGTGGGIKNVLGNIELYGGTIEQNNAGTHGGAIVHDDGSLAFKGTVSIPCGTEPISTTNPLNDVWIADEKSVSLDSNFERSSNSEKIALTPEMPARNLTLLTGSVSTTNVAYFDLKAPGFKLDHVEQSSNHYGKTSLNKIVTTIYVKASDATDPSGATNADSTWNNSTYAFNDYTDNQSKPFESLTKALQFITYQASNEDYTIYMTGTFRTSYAIPDSNTTNADSPITLTKGTTAKTITIMGGTALSQGTDPEPQDVINSYVSDSDNQTTLTVTTDVPVTLTKIKINGGRARSNSLSNGGGIKIASGSNVTLDEYAFISGNYAKCGGGIFNEGTLTLKNKAKIYSNTHDKTGGSLPVGGGGIYNYGTDAKVYITGGNIYSNSASNDSACGGAIYNNGGSVFIYGDATFGLNAQGNTAGSGGCIYNAGYLYLGYKSAKNDKTPNETQNWSGKIQYNRAPHGAGIFNAAGSYVYMKTGIISSNVNVSNGTTAYNNYGLGVWNAGNFVMSGGSIEKHINETRYGGGAGVFNTKDGTFDMQGGSISENYIVYRSSSTSYKGYGGAVYNKGIFKMKGSANIPYGATINQTFTQETGCNDVYLADKNDDTGDGQSGMPTAHTKITVGNVTNSPAATITPPYYGRGQVMLQALTTQGETGRITDLTYYVGKFAVIQPDATIASEWKNEYFDDKTVAYLNAPIYVKGSGGSSTYDGASLTKAVTSLADAESIITTVNNSAMKYDIIISGTLTHQSFTEDINGKAAGITLRGKDGSYAENPDTIKGTSANGSDALALWIKTTVPITIKNIKITQGNNQRKTGSDFVHGGGINIMSNANVTLSDGVLITQNHAKFGSGVYNKGTLTVTGSGPEDSQRCIISNNYSDFAGVVKTGGGIDNGGVLNIEGYAKISANGEGNNPNSYKGGAIYNYGTLNMKGNFLITNRSSGRPNDIFIQTDSTITIKDALTGDGPFGKISVPNDMADDTVLIQKGENVSNNDFTTAVGKFGMYSEYCVLQNDGTFLRKAEVTADNIGTILANVPQDGQKIVMTGSAGAYGSAGDNHVIDDACAGLTKQIHLDISQLTGNVCCGGFEYSNIQEFTCWANQCWSGTKIANKPDMVRLNLLGSATLSTTGGENNSYGGLVNNGDCCIGDNSLRDIYYVNATTATIYYGFSRAPSASESNPVNIHLPSTVTHLFFQNTDGLKVNQIKLVYDGTISQLKSKIKASSGIELSLPNRAASYTFHCDDGEVTWSCGTGGQNKKWQ